MRSAENPSETVGFGHRFLRSFHPVGLATGLVFFAWSMTPSLLPRVWYFQGVATGISVATGYGIGVLVAWLVRSAGVRPSWSPRSRRFGWWALAAAAVLVIPTFLALGSWWQQIIRDLVGVPRAPRAMYVSVLLVSAVVAVAIVAAARGIRRLTRVIAHRCSGVIPLPVARVVAVIVVAVIAITAVNGALYRGLLGIAQITAEAADHSTADGITPPTSPLRSGSAASAQPWDSLGREGRTFVASGPDAQQIEDVTGRPAIEPIRVYAGRESADTVADVADLVVAELEAAGAFDRRVLAVATTTGRGWVNNNVASALEYVNGGDTAIAAMQYSFLPSALSFIADRETPQIAGRALFDRVYDAWSARPEGSRPTLVVFGESLGSYGGQAAFSSGDDLVARTDGALLVGTPNFAQPWRTLTDQRDAGSSERLPVVDGGKNIRFASRPEDTALPEPWSSPRIVFWQHASDPITWWSFRLAVQRPDWLAEPLGPDVDPGMRWIPLVTFWQVTLDMVFSADVPSGFGHAFGPEAVHLWADILQPPGMDTATADRVQAALSEAG